MSSFKSTFTKEDGGEKNLDYDESAFYYFSSVLLVVIIIPLAYCFIKYKVFFVESQQAPIQLKDLKSSIQCSCSQCANKSTKNLIKKPTFGFSGCCQFLVLLFLIYCLFIAIQAIMESPQGLRSFDPYTILEIDIGASERQIKKAFYALTQIWHPDKNPGNAIAQGKYRLITKAYETLTDQTAKANYQKWGNPDGPTPLKFAIGLPKFLLNAENHISILIVFFTIVVIVVPGLVLFYVKSSQNLDKNGILQDNAQLYARYLNQNMLLKNCLFMVAASLEFEDIKTNKQESVELKKLLAKYPQFMPKLPNIHPRIIKLILLQLAHMDRKELSPSMKKDLNFVLAVSGSMIESIIDIALQLNQIPKAKRMSIHTFKLLIEFSQLLTQGLTLHSSNLLSLPHIDQNNIKLLTTKKKPKIQDIRNQTDFKALEKKLSAQKVFDIKETLKLLPDLKVVAKAFVENEERIQIGDIVTVEVTIERMHLKQDQQAGPIHSNTFPLSKFEKLWIIICDPVVNRAFHVFPILSLNRVIVHDKFKFPAGSIIMPLKPGKYHWEVHVKSDSYYGFDVEVPLDFVIFPESGNKEVFVHPDDQNLEKQGTWIQSVMSGMQYEEESSEEEDIPENEGEEEAKIDL